MVEKIPKIQNSQLLKFFPHKTLRINEWDDENLSGTLESSN